MKQNGNKRLITLALLLAMATAGMIFIFLQQVQAAAVDPKLVTVTVASRDIPARTIITADMLKQAQVIDDYIHPQALVEYQDLVGSITSTSILAGEQILINRVVRPGQISYLAYMVPAGRRAISINISEVVGVGYMIQPGDTVDVIATVGSENEGALNTRIILQDIPVLAIAQDRSNISEERAKLSRTYTLSVTPQQAETLVLAEEMGRIRLALRNVTDDAIVNTPGLQLDTLLNRNR